MAARRAIRDAEGAEELPDAFSTRPANIARDGGRAARPRPGLDLGKDTTMRDAVIVSTARTPIGHAYRGAFNDTQAAGAGRPCRGARGRARRPRARRGRGRASSAPRCSRARPAATSRARRRCAPGCRSRRRHVASTANAPRGMMAIATAAKQVIHDGMEVAVGGGVESICLVQNEHSEPAARADPWLPRAQAGALHVDAGDRRDGRRALRHQPRGAGRIRPAIQQRTAAAQQAGKFDDEIVPLPTVMKVHGQGDRRGLATRRSRWTATRATAPAPRSRPGRAEAGASRTG